MNGRTVACISRASSLVYFVIFKRMDLTETPFGCPSHHLKLQELERDDVLLVSGHHGALDVSNRLRLVIDEGGGRDLPIAAMLLPSRIIIRDIDPLPQKLSAKEEKIPVLV